MIKWLSCLFSLFLLSPVLADDQGEARRLVEQSEILALDVIIEKARQEVGGRLIELEFEYERGRYIYEVEMLGVHGKVWELKYDAQTGELIKREEDD